jgi:hypothetical protein
MSTTIVSFFSAAIVLFREILESHRNEPSGMLRLVVSWKLTDI